MEDVHMEEAGAVTPGQGNHQQQPSAAPSSAAAAAPQATSPTHPPAGEAGVAPASQREHSSSNTADTPSHTLAGVAVHHAASSHEKSQSREDSSGMDIDASASDHVKPDDTNEHSNDIVKANSNSVEHGDARSPSRPAVIQPAAPDSSATSAATVATQGNPASGSAEAERTSTADIEEKVTTAPAPAVDMAASTAEVSQAAKPESSPAPPVRTYTPQFKFTTFTAMAPLPTRNVTSNFLKTDKNYVLKDMSERQRRRKRKAGDQDSTAGLAMADEAEAEVQDKENSESAEGADEGSALLLKKKRNDELSAIRKGIFADDDLDLEDETTPKKDQDEDDEGLYSSESDSEASVVNEMDENGETKSASLFGTTSSV